MWKFRQPLASLRSLVQETKTAYKPRFKKPYKKPYKNRINSSQNVALTLTLTPALALVLTLALALTLIRCPAAGCLATTGPPTPPRLWPGFYKAIV